MSRKVVLSRSVRNPSLNVKAEIQIFNGIYLKGVILKTNTLRIMKRNSYVTFVEKASFLKIVVKCINLAIILKRVVKYVEKCALTNNSWKIIWALSIKWMKWNWNAKSVHFLQILNQAWNPTYMLITKLKITRNVLTVNIILICSIVFRFSMITVVEFEVKKTKRSEKIKLEILGFCIFAIIKESWMKK